MGTHVAASLARALRGKTARNLTFNFAGLALPLAAALISIPILIRNMGLERFGILMLLQAALTYVGTLDLGLSAATTYRISTLLDRTRARAVHRVVATGMLTLVLAGGALTLVCILLINWIASRMNATSEIPAGELVWSIRIAALSIPSVLMASLFVGVLSGYQKFSSLNLVRVPGGVLTFVAPAIASMWHPDLVLASLLLCGIRVGTAVAFAVQCRALLPGLWQNPFASFSSAVLRQLLRFGGWLTVSNLVGPFMVYLDRFYLGAIRSADDVARYVTPYELASKLSLLPAAVLPVLFPLLVSGVIRRNAGQTQLPLRTVTWIALASAFPATFMAAAAPLIMKYWLSGQMEVGSATVLQILSGAMVVNNVALVFLFQLQSRGRTDVVARIHIAELAGYVLVLIALADRFGIVGVALAWFLRAILDAMLLCHVATCPLASREKRATWVVLGLAIMLAVVLALLPLLHSFSLRLIAFVGPLVCLWTVYGDLAHHPVAPISSNGDMSPMEAERCRSR